MLIFVELQATLAPLVVKIEANDYTPRKKFKPTYKWLHFQKKLLIELVILQVGSHQR